MSLKFMPLGEVILKLFIWWRWTLLILNFRKSQANFSLSSRMVCSNIWYSFQPVILWEVAWPVLGCLQEFSVHNHCCPGQKWSCGFLNKWINLKWYLSQCLIKISLKTHNNKNSLHPWKLEQWACFQIPGESSFNVPITRFKSITPQQGTLRVLFLKKTKNLKSTLKEGRKIFYISSTVWFLVEKYINGTHQKTSHLALHGARVIF